MKLNHCVLVDTVSALNYARRNFSGAVIFSDNPLLANDPAANGGIRDITRYLDQTEATELGEGAVDILMELDDLLIELDAAERYGVRRIPLNITVCMRHLLSNLMQRSVMLLRALESYPDAPLHLVILDNARWAPSNPWNIPRYASPYRSLAEYGLFKDRTVSTTLAQASVPKNDNDTSIDDNLLRALLLPPFSLLYEVFQRHRVIGFGKKGNLAVGKLCEPLREALPWLYIRRQKVGRFTLPAYAGPEPFPHGSPPDIDPWLIETIRPKLLGHPVLARFFNATESSAIIDMFLLHLSAGLTSLAATEKSLELALDDTFGDQAGPKSIVTSGYYGPIASLLYSICKQRGINLIDFEHGATTGIARTSERRLRYSEATTCDILLTCSERAKRSFVKASANPEVPAIHVIGLADQTRHTHWRGLQRQRARRRLGLSRPETAVMHVSSLLYGGNMRPGDDGPIESFVFETEKQLLTETYRGLSKRVFYKPYPTERYPHHPGYGQLFDLAPNIELLEHADFRYIRAAADVIVTSGNSSTLAWCAGVDVPLVYLDSLNAHSLLNNELRQQFADAFFLISLDAADWSDRLRALLAEDLCDIRKRWHKKSAARNHLLVDGFFGHPGNVGRRSARLIMENHV